jgi:multidrug efflux pump subunit AcrA (membrane-fusion protein)
MKTNTYTHPTLVQPRRWIILAGFLALTVAATGLWAPRAVLAHGGEDHGSPAPAGQVVSGRQTASAQSENFDIVAQYGNVEVGKPASFDLYLSDYETNTPVGGATIQVSVSGNDSTSATATAEKEPGLYNVSLTFLHDGHYDLLFDITSPERSDIVEVKGIEVGAQGSEPPKTAASRTSSVIVISIVAVLLILAWLYFRNRRNASHRAATAGVILLLLTLAGSSLYAHGGEDHGEAGGSGVTSATPGYMSKASQFLLGVRTVLAKNQSVSKQISALGRVVAPPTSQVQVYAPQSGLLIASSDVPYPNQGDWVRKGQAIAVLQVLDQFVILAPISGIVSSIHAVPGEQVDPTHELFTIYDYTKVWVEANLFENDLIHLEPKPPASLSVDISPEESFPIRFVNFESVVDPTTRTLKAIYKVDNQKMILRPGMIVSVHIESEKRLDALVVPDISVMDWEGQKVVFVHEQPEIFEMRPIKILGYYGDVVAVKGSLAEGERVVTTGAYELLSIPHLLAEERSK